MARIIRTQHVQYDTVSLLAVQGKGTSKFLSSGQPGRIRPNFGVVLSGDIRVTKSTNADGYFIIVIGKGAKADRRRTFFRGDALVRIGSRVLSLDAYWDMMVLVNGE